MSSVKLNPGTKVLAAVLAGILILLCIGLYVLYRNTLRKPTAAPQIMALPTTQLMAGGKEFLPVIHSGTIPTALVENKAPAAAQAPSETPENLWRITRVDKLAYNFQGIPHDLGSFENISTGEVIQAFCANPGRPAPQPGDFFIRNAWDVLIPTRNPEGNQRFIVIRP